MYVVVPTNPPSLGLSLQWAPLSNTEDVWRILDVTPNSPADVAGLLPYSDYVIGSPEGLVRGESGLPELIEDVGAHVGDLIRSFNVSLVHGTATSTASV